MDDTLYYKGLKTANRKELTAEIIQADCTTSSQLYSYVMSHSSDFNKLLEYRTVLIDAWFVYDHALHIYPGNKYYVDKFEFYAGALDLIDKYIADFKDY